MNETRALAEFVAGIQYRDLTEEVIDKAKNLILDQLGCQLAFATLPWSKIIYRYVEAKHGGKEISTVSYYGLRTVTEDAVFANATFGHGFEMDDDEAHTMSHPGVVVIPSALALGEAKGINGKEFLTAVVAGYDAMLRVGMSSVSMMNRGFHTTAVAGPFGAAAAAGKVMGQDGERLLNAFSIAASEASGISEYTISGGSVKRLHAGFAAQSGVKAVSLSELGVTGPTAALEGKKGVLQAFANEYFPEEITRDLGREFRILWTGHKPYCCCAAQHTTIDAVSEIIKEHHVRWEEINEIMVEQMPREIRAVGNIVQPEDMISAQFSGRFGIALRLIRGSNGFRDYSDENIRDPELLELAGKITYAEDHEMEKMPPGAAPTRITMKLKNGDTYTSRVDYAKGTPENPMTAEEIKEKFRGLASTVIPQKQVEKIIGTVRDLENLENIQGLIHLLTIDKSSNSLWP
ncbi:MAG: MmgE/PrpD family protein [Deltaproteobacteria bacterium]|nr:MmgE/PrpD family protein [Deltaproteobacteria bacterium]